MDQYYILCGDRLFEDYIKGYEGNQAKSDFLEGSYPIRSRVMLPITGVMQSLHKMGICYLIGFGTAQGKISGSIKQRSD
jgi:hypothetical protein